jgi:hypothetical protein
MSVPRKKKPITIKGSLSSKGQQKDPVVRQKIFQGGELSRTAEENAGKRRHVVGKQAALILAQVAPTHGRQGAQHDQRPHNHRNGKAKDLNSGLEGKIAELVGGEAGEDLDQEEEEGPVRCGPGLHGHPPVGEDGGVCWIGLAHRRVGTGGGIVLAARADHQLGGLAAGLLQGGGQLSQSLWNSKLLQEKKTTFYHICKEKI